MRRLKEGEGKEIHVIGSGELLQTLMRDDLVDEYRLMLNPLVMGKGKRLFREGMPRTPLRLAESTASGTGVLVLRYERAESTA